MKKVTNTEEAPWGYMHCFNKECKIADRCLHYQAGLHIPANRPTVSVFNPALLKNDGSCKQFADNKPVRYTYGWSQMFCKLPHEKAVDIQKHLLRHFGSNAWYRYKRKEKKFTPEAQAYVASVFREYGVTDEPQFDEYQYEYHWK